MTTSRIVASMTLLVAVSAAPVAAAAPVQPGDCLGDGSYDPQGRWEACWGIHYNSQGRMDCIGQYLDTEASPDNCVGIRL